MIERHVAVFVPDRLNDAGEDEEEDDDDDDDDAGLEQKTLCRRQGSVRERFRSCNLMPEPRAKAPVAGVLARAISGWSELRYS